MLGRRGRAREIIQHVHFGWWVSDRISKTQGNGAGEDEDGEDGEDGEDEREEEEAMALPLAMPEGVSGREELGVSNSSI